MLEGVESAGRHARPGRRIRGGTGMDPVEDGVPVEGRDRRLRSPPGGGASPDESSAARAEQPFVASGYEQVASELRDIDVLIPEPMNPVETEDHPLVGITFVVHR